MQKKKKVSKSKTQSVKKVASKNAQVKPIVKKAAKKLTAPVVTPVVSPVVSKREKPAKVKAEPKAKSASAAAPKEVASPAMQASKVDLKNMSQEAQEQYKKWLKLQKQLAVEKTLDYKMTDDFEIKTPISHKVHGWGVVMQKRDNYIDVLFEIGMKTLIVNYKT